MIHLNLITNFQTDTLAGYLKNDLQFPQAQVEVADYDQLITTLSIFTNTRSKGAIVVWCSPEKIFHEFQNSFHSSKVDLNKFDNELDHYFSLLKNVSNLNQIIHFTFQPTQFTRGNGTSDVTNETSIYTLLHRMNQKLISLARSCKNIQLIDSQSIYNYNHSEHFQSKLWYLSKNPFTNNVYKKAVNEIKATLRALYGGNKKLLILDLDDTLWGGIVGDDGWKNIKIGGHDYIGEAFQDFQKEIFKLKNQGIILAIASKNDESNVWEAFSKNTEMVLKKEHFSSYRINWDDKAKNISDILKELNVMPNSAVFLDDNPVERKRVKDLIPEIEVPELPSDKTQYRIFLAQLNLFDSLSITNEDLRRTEMYNEEKVRDSSKINFSNTDDWLKSLETVVEFSKLNESDLERTHQLFNKTNQMNLTTRRLSSDDLWKWSQTKNQSIYTFKVSDKFGSAGLTGILGLQHDNKQTIITDYILSCRVMGRKVEESMIAIATEFAIKNSAEKIIAHYIPTEKNKPCFEFFKKYFRLKSENVFELDALNEFVKPKSIKFKNN